MMILPPPPLLLQHHLQGLSDPRRVSISLPDLRGSSNPLRFTIIMYYHASNVPTRYPFFQVLSIVVYPKVSSFWREHHSKCEF